MTHRDVVRHHRRSIRLGDHDYSSIGAYFVTIVSHDREGLFGEIRGGGMELNDCGRIVADEWLRTAGIRPRIALDEWIVMPNHLHGIIVISDAGVPLAMGEGQWGRGTLQRAPTAERFGKPTSDSIPTIVRLFKSATTKRINAARGTPGEPVWQRNYYEHIIRDDHSLQRIREYIMFNPARWSDDRENPRATGR